MKTKKIVSVILTGSMLAGLSGVLTGCGSTKIDIFSEVSVEVTGYNGYGEVTFSEGDWLEEVVDQVEEHLSLREESEIFDAVEFSYEPSEGLSNGDTVTVTVDVDEDVFDEYKLKLESETATFPVEDLEEIQEFDPFENVTVTFSGYAPNGMAKVETTSDETGLSLDYDLDVDSGLSNGDTVTVTLLSYYTEEELEEYWLSFFFIDTATEQTYTVEGLTSYAASLDEITEDMLTKMDSQARDVISSNISSGMDTENGEIFNGADLLGYYFLTTKDGYESNYVQNEIYLIYQINADWTGYTDGDAGTFSYFYYVKFENALILDDGTCSVDLSEYDYPSWHSVEVSSFVNDYGYTCSVNADGYTSKESMFSECVASKLDEYTYESTVE